MININVVKDLLYFIRFRICFFTSFLAMTGYLLFNLPSIELILVSLASFFGCAGTYSYNNMRDEREDLINRERINPFVYSNKGSLITIGCFFLGALFLPFLPAVCAFFYVTSTLTGLIYSSFRVKRYFLVKNLYTGFGITQVFLLGAAKLTGDVVLCYFLFSILFFVGSLISDLRDYRGDKAVGIKTLPVYVGYDATRKFIYFLLIMFSISILGLNLPELFILLPFALLIFFFLGMNKPDIAHFCGGMSFILLAIRLMSSC